MPVFGVDRLGGRREPRISEGAYGDRYDFRLSGGPRGDAIGATRSAPASETMAQEDLRRIARAARSKLPADACRKACGHQIILRRDLVAERAAAISN